MNVNRDKIKVVHFRKKKCNTEKQFYLGVDLVDIYQQYQNESIIRVWRGWSILRGAARFCHSLGGQLDFANLLRGVLRFSQILIIKQTIAQIRPQNTYRGVIKKLMYIYVRGYRDSANPQRVGGAEILPILRGGGARQKS